MTSMDLGVDNAIEIDFHRNCYNFNTFLDCIFHYLNEN